MDSSKIHREPDYLASLSYKPKTIDIPKEVLDKSKERRLVAAWDKRLRKKFSRMKPHEMDTLEEVLISEGLLKEGDLGKET